MKKFVTAIILVCMMLSMAACGGSSEAEYKLGMGVVVSTDSSSDNNAQVDATVATVVTDANGKIVLCRLDCALLSGTSRPRTSKPTASARPPMR